MRPVIVDIMREVVNQMRYDEPAPYYLHGHPLEVVNIMSEKATSSIASTMFPLIALFQDFDEEQDEGFVTATLNIIIANRTKPDYRASERYEKNFKPILYPMLEDFIRSLSHNKWVELVQVPYTKIDHVYWGKEGLYGSEANIFNDYIDAIELRDITVTFKNNCITKNC